MPGSAYMGARTQMTVPEGADHIGEIQAWDMNTGEEVWTREFDSHNWGGILTTSGNLIFSGGTSDRCLGRIMPPRGVVVGIQNQLRDYRRAFHLFS